MKYITLEPNEIIRRCNKCWKYVIIEDGIYVNFICERCKKKLSSKTNCDAKGCKEEFLMTNHFIVSPGKILYYCSDKCLKTYYG